MRKSAFSLKGLGIGAILSIAIGLIAPYVTVFQYHWIGFNPSSPGALLFFACVVFVNIIVAFLSRRFALSKPDLILIYCMLLLAVLLCLQLFGNVSFLMYPYRDTEDFRAVNQFFGEIPIVQILEQINFEEQEIGFVWESDLVSNLESVDLHNSFPDTVAESWYLTDLTELDFLVYPSGNLDNVVLTSMK